MARTFPALVLGFLLVSPLRGQQCPSWSEQYSLPGPGTGFWSVAWFDAGSGERAYFGGSTSLDPVSGLWEAVPGIRRGYAHVHDDGNGRALFVANVEGVVRWNGTDLRSVGEPGPHESTSFLTTFDDGTGPALYACGRFTSIEGVSANRIAKWDGAGWSPLGSGLDDDAFSMCVFDDGSGPSLFVVGAFLSAGGTSAPHVAKWDGVSWSPVGVGLMSDSGQVSAMAVHDDGTGPALYLAGDFQATASGTPLPGLAKWDGSSLHDPFAGVPSLQRRVLGLASFRGSLYASGYAETHAQGSLHRWNGAAWELVDGKRVGLENPGGNDSPTWLFVHDDGSGSGPKLHVVGQFQVVGDRHMAGYTAYDGQNFELVGSVDRFGADRDAEVARVINGTLYVGGEFEHVGIVRCPGIASFDGTSWSPLGTGVGGPAYTVCAIVVYDDGTGPSIYAGGAFSHAGGQPATNLARWDGSTWSPVGGGTNGSVEALAVYDDGTGPRLYVGGVFSSAGSVGSPGLASWDGTSWRAEGPLTGNAVEVQALGVFDLGSGPGLYAGGLFSGAGSVTASNIARYDAAGWTPLGLGTDQGRERVNALAFYDDGSGAGPALYVAGEFRRAGGTPVKRIGRWNGSTWSSLGPGIGHGGSDIYDIAVHDNSLGRHLYVTGKFPYAGPVLNLSNIARWNGTTWGRLEDAGLGGLGRGLASYVNPTLGVPELFVAGNFNRPTSMGSDAIAFWQDDCCCPQTDYCLAGTTSNGCYARIEATGFPSVLASSGFRLTASPVEGDRLGVLFYGVSGRRMTPWAPGSNAFLCVQPPHQRTRVMNSGGYEGTCTGSLSFDWNELIATTPGALGSPFLGGETVWVQALFRDLGSPLGMNLSNGYEFVIGP